MKANMEDSISGVVDISETDYAYDAKLEIDTIKNCFFGVNYEF